MDKIKLEIDGFEGVIQEAKAKSENARNKDQSTIDSADVFNKIINDSNEELSALYKKKDE